MSESIRLPESMKDWTIEGELGQGATGHVFLLSKEDNGQTINSALKVIRIPHNETEYACMLADANDDRQALQKHISEEVDKCRREIDSMKNLCGSPNIVTIQDYCVEKDEDNLNWTIYIRMEYLKPLKDWKDDHVTEENTIEDKDIIKLAADMCQALIACEDKGIIHRDIKPENVFYSESGCFKLGDFGISRFAAEQGLRATGCGTPRYIAPEIDHCEKYDNRADLYSLGIMLYELKNKGRIPFESMDARVLSSEEKEKAVKARIHGAAITQAPIGVSAPLGQIILKTLSFNPDDRYPSARDLLDALQALNNTVDPKVLADTQPGDALPAYAVEMEKTFVQLKIESDVNFGYMDSVKDESTGYLRKAYELIFIGNPNWDHYLRRLLERYNPTSIIPRANFLAACEECGLFTDPDTAKQLADRLHLTVDNLHKPNEKAKAKINNMDDAGFFLFYNQLASKDLATESFIRKLLGKLDFSSFCKIGEFLTYLEIANKKPFLHEIKRKFSSIGKFKEWRKINSDARDARNRFSSHINSEQRLSYEDATNVLKAYTNLVNALKCNELKPEYDHFQNAVDNHQDQCRYLFVSLDRIYDSVCGKISRKRMLAFIKDTVRDFRQEQLEPEGYLFCCQNDYISIQNVIQNVLDQINDLFPDGANDNPQMVESFIEDDQNDIPMLSTLNKLDIGDRSLSPRLPDEQLQELFATHHVICDASFLSSENGRRFINQRGSALLSSARPLLATTTARYLMAFSKEKNARAGYETFRLLQEKKAAGYVGSKPEQNARNDLGSICSFLKNWSNVRICLMTENPQEAQFMFKPSDFPYLVIAKATKSILPSEQPTLRLCASSFPLKQSRKAESKASEKPDTSHFSTVPYVHPVTIENRQNQKTAQIVSATPSPKANPNTPSDVPKADKHKNTTDKELQKSKQINAAPQISDSSVTLFDEAGNPIRLVRKLTREDGSSAEGGEGAVWETDQPDCVAKTYHSDNKIQLKAIENKLKAVASHWPNDSHICKPRKILYNRNGDYSGFLMQKVPYGHVDMSLSLLKINSPSEEAKYPDRSRLYLVKTLIKISSLLAKLHKNEILMGDLNPNNILISRENPEDVYFVDCDSYQFRDYPSGVGVEEYTPPEVYRKYGKNGKINYSDVLRTEDDENYIFAVIVFQVLFCGASPFTNKQNITQRQMMEDKRFSFREDKSDIPGPEYMIWQNLPQDIKTIFNNTFLKWSPSTPGYWCKKLEDYKDKIIEGMGAPDDPWTFSNELYPSKYLEYDRNNLHYKDAECQKCGSAFNYPINSLIVPEFCRKCSPLMYKSQQLTCEDCGNTFTGNYAVAWKKRKGIYKEILCPECRPKEVACDFCGKKDRLKGSKLSELRGKNKPVLCHECRNTPDDATISIECKKCGNYAEETKSVILEVIRKNGQYVCPEHRIPCCICAKPSALCTGSEEAEKILRKGHWIYCSKCNPYRQPKTK